MFDLDPQTKSLLLRRPEWSVDIQLDRLASALGNHVVVTGAGGSIAAALIDRLLSIPDLTVTAIDQAESGLFALRQRHPQAMARLELKLMHLSEEAELRRCLNARRPKTVFHTAAHKHVALAEENVCAVIRNNLTQTRLLQGLCLENSVQNLVVISTDKAVAPKGVMGASKRLCEWALLREDNHSQALVLRLPNVLASQGSVLEVFAAAKKAGTPYPISDQAMTRQFISLSEASDFLLGTLAENFRGLYALENQTPCRIVTLAQRFHELTTKRKKPFATKVIGIGAGEKLSEEMHEASESPRATELNRVLKLEVVAQDVDFAALDLIAKSGDDQAMRQALVALGFDLMGLKP